MFKPRKCLLFYGTGTQCIKLSRNNIQVFQVAVWRALPSHKCVARADLILGVSLLSVLALH